MPTDSISSFAGNLMLFLGLALLQDWLAASRLMRYRLAYAVCIGFCFGGAAIASMLMPAAQGSGLVWDARHVAVGLGAMLGGPVAGIVAAAMAAGYRASLGGIGVLGGVGSVFVVALLGIAIWYWSCRGSGRARPDFRHLAVLTALIGPAALSSYLFLMLIDLPLAKTLLAANGLGFALQVTIGTAILGGGILLLARRRELERHLGGLSENFPGMIYRRRQLPDGSITYPYVSAGAQTLFGLDPAAIQRDAGLLTALVDPEDRARYLAVVDDIAQNMKPLTVDSRIRPADGGPVKWVRNFVRPSRAPDDSIIWDGVVLDITEQRRSEEQLRVAREQAEAANLAKSNFLASMSHELRTPLNAVLGFSQLLGMNNSAHLSDSQREFIQMIESSGRQLLALIEQVLDLAKIEAGHVTLSMEVIAANTLLHDLGNFAKPLAEKRQQSVVFEPMAEAVHVRVDLTRFNQIMVNFLSNAAKYSRDQGRIEVGCVSAADGGVEFYVADNGFGIPLEQQSKVFEVFNRLGREASTIEGTGIGLATARRLAELMQGEIGFSSVAERGSRFWVRFPRVAAPAPAQVPVVREAPRTGAAAKAARILYIEDNAANILLVRRILATMPQAALLTAENGADGIAVAQAEHPDLILLDIHLPDMDGFEVLRRLRADPALSGTPVIALTADADRRSLERGNAAGFDDYLTKPIQVDKFLATLWQILGSARGA